MTDQAFDIKILDLHWIQNVDDPTDLCAHGHVYVKIGNQILSDKDAGDWTLSSTALYLMRTFKADYKADDFGSQLLPCCGHFMVIDDKTNKLLIFGCPNGIDWTILHLDNKIKHITDSGQEAIIDFEEYKTLVFNFADKVEQFYKNSAPKTIPSDESDKKAYLAFWKEWRELRDN
ncbi:hypothetical protein HUW51_00200 (plasmid) [Adhaeribacter swui]|uniref:Uncharacterized protein n=1 Tax=Adhaeribacter swui TaxID=2086471 RepID=A0A7G7G229_9BACT|nr:hypothetical protein [Adhaeribacter swui]QNF31213.1 hypothetical protein HUW51_00200 [Adhaeribacter swui]